MWPLLGGLTAISWLGNFGGKKLIPFGWDIALVTLLALLVFELANWCAFSLDKARSYRQLHMPAAED